jgi:uncharacterized lipoprotein YddW (UPF0748 family)
MRLAVLNWLTPALLVALPASATEFPAAAVDSAGAAARAAGSPSADSALVAPAGAGPGIETPSRWVDYLWVARTSLVSPQAIDRALTRARDMGVRGVLVQVVGRGDAYYRSDVLPRAEALPAPRAGEEPFDPLGYLLPRAREAGLEVHAWINCCLVWSGPHPPRDHRHVVNAHPEWIARLRNGRRMDRLGPAGYRRLKVEGAFLSPAHPGVRRWVASAAAEIVGRYPVDGIHLDYIRQPPIDIGYDATTRAAFALRSGVDRMRRETIAPERRAALDSAFTAFQCEQVTAMVQEVRDSLRARRVDLQLTAAVKPDIRDAERRMAQPWTRWVASGLVDRVFPMCYAPTTQTVLDELLEAARRIGTERVVPGIAVYNAGPATAAAHLKGARELGFRQLALYSADALAARPGYWAALSARLAPARGGIH